MSQEYRKKPVVISAIKFDGTLTSLEAFHIPSVSQELGSRTAQIATLEGVMTAEPGDWIIRGIKGEFYPCKPEIFAASYEPADRATVPAAQQASADELHFNAQRLRNVAALVGLADAVPQDDATLDGARGAVLGLIAGVLRKREAEAASVREAIFKALRSYHMTNMNFSDEEGGGSYALVDLMTPDCKSIGEGEAEMQILADEIDAAIRALQGKPEATKGEGA